MSHYKCMSFELLEIVFFFFRFLSFLQEYTSLLDVRQVKKLLRLLNKKREEQSTPKQVLTNDGTGGKQVSINVFFLFLRCWNKGKMLLSFTGYLQPFLQTNQRKFIWQQNHNQSSAVRRCLEAFFPRFSQAVPVLYFPTWHRYHVFPRLAPCHVFPCLAPCHGIPCLIKLVVCIPLWRCCMCII